MSLQASSFSSFNQSFSNVSIAYPGGYMIFGCDPFKKLLSNTDGSYSIVKMFESSSLLVVVGSGVQPAFSPRRLKIMDIKRGKMICELTYITSIKNIELNQNKLIVSLQNEIYIYEVEGMKLIHVIKGIFNPEGLISISFSFENNYLAYSSYPLAQHDPNFNDGTGSLYNTESGAGTPLSRDDDANTFNDSEDGSGSVMTNETGNVVPTSNTEEAALIGVQTPSNRKTKNNVKQKGDITIFNLKTLQPSMVVEAHKSEISAVSLSSDGTLLTTASKQGTIIKVFRVCDGVNICQFRRGTYSVRVNDIRFSQDNEYLTVTSSSSTIHIFQVKVEEKPERGANGPEIAGQEERDLNVVDSTGAKKHQNPWSMSDVFKSSSKGITKRATKQITQMFPFGESNSTEELEPRRNIAYCKIPGHKSHHTAIAYVEQLQQVSLDDYPELALRKNFTATDKNTIAIRPLKVVTSEGLYYRFMFAPEKGGECTLVSQYSLLDS
ncbi:phosphoinositide binding protein ATG18 KNAG_0C02000 [Huiozyma naganishii CBS 8797]|uniref:Autophagy-related protein 18 n=1 Tax=Huiozyma naganishii (strain ATCC MYA-139 / BCRC 22969 / CBS 8797 / KCTC 17520 / NBRC 10181 / NCYC 3082 / Yp74L-3) TaxID=1071383 RepID=J7RIF7_HUIN7|nr:hypothetical protein KNAG_0C02000 [Kazachstania naganishii CBS 8797]CCK69313.1 hypothetical protein KNAG_0C02000 [Kazachstania naganishii CBS 8797]